MSAQAYIPVPVSAAQQIAEEFQKSTVIVNAWDPVHGLLHTITYGVTPEDKANAAKGGEIAAQALGGMTELAIHHEDYRLILAQQLRDALKAIYELLPKVDNGRCAICKHGYRGFDKHGHLRAKCTNRKCVSRVVEAALRESHKFLGSGKAGA